jgi:release factor glutamine methyltransferase
MQKKYSEAQIEIKKKYLPSYGRTKSRSLTLKHKELLNNLFPKIQIHEDKEFLNKFFKDNKGKNIQLEIGFGVGENIVNLALHNPEIIYIGCEVYVNSFAVCLQKIAAAKLENIFLYNKDTRILLENLPDKSLDKVYILFPDPWPKNKQMKRRIFNQQLLDILAEKLKPNGMIRFATDIDSYFEQVIDLIFKQKKFKLVTKESDFYRIPTDHVLTKYQNKAIKEGRKSRFIEIVFDSFKITK